MLPSFPLQVGEITVHVLRTCNRRFIKPKTRRDFSKSTVIHAGESCENSVRHFLKETHVDVKIFILTTKTLIQFCLDIVVYVLSPP
jgi:hypothetical protein